MSLSASFSRFDSLSHPLVRLVGRLIHPSVLWEVDLRSCPPSEPEQFPCSIGTTGSSCSEWECSPS